MHSSSTFSFRRAIPATRSSVAVAVALLIATALLALGEGGVRRAGFPPSDLSYRDWHLNYKALKAGECPNDVLFMGDSRVELGLDPAAFDRAASTRSRNFGHTMGAPVWVLEDALTGLEAAPPRLVVIGYTPASWVGDRYAAITRTHLVDAMSLGQRVERTLGAEVATRISLAQQGRLWRLLTHPPELPPVLVVRGARGQRQAYWPPSPLLRRTAQADKARDIPWLLGDGTLPVAESQARFRRVAERLAAAHVPILIVRMPASEAVREAEEQAYPASLFQTLALPGVELLDPSQQTGFSPLIPVDGSHLEAEAAERFSEELASWVRRKGLLRE